MWIHVLGLKRNWWQRLDLNWLPRAYERLPLPMILPQITPYYFVCDATMLYVVVIMVKRRR